MKGIVAATLALIAIPFAASAQTGAPSDCSGTVGTVSTAITFPSSGNTGPTVPRSYLMIQNVAGTNKLAVNTGAAAVIDTNGSISLDSAGSSVLWSAAQGTLPPANVNIIASASSTPYTCKYQ